MSRTISPSSQKPYGVTQVVAIWCLARSSFYTAHHRQLHPRESHKRGPQVLSDEKLLAEIRQLLEAPVFTGEGYRKIWARLRHKGIRTSKERVLRLLRENQLLSPARRSEQDRGNPHEGRIVTEAPDQMWGTDATRQLHRSRRGSYHFRGYRPLHGRMRGHSCRKEGNAF